jgi:hypothetical protein
MDFEPLDALARLRCQVFRSAPERAGFALTLARLPGTGHGPVLAGCGDVSPLYEETLVDWITVRCR